MDSSSRTFSCQSPVEVAVVFQSPVDVAVGYLELPSGEVVSRAANESSLPLYGPLTREETEALECNANKENIPPGNVPLSGNLSPKEKTGSTSQVAVASAPQLGQLDPGLGTPTLVEISSPVSVDVETFVDPCLNAGADLNAEATLNTEATPNPEATLNPEANPNTEAASQSAEAGPMDAELQEPPRLTRSLSG